MGILSQFCTITDSQEAKNSMFTDYQQKQPQKKSVMITSCVLTFPFSTMFLLPQRMQVLLTLFPEAYNNIK